MNRSIRIANSSRGTPEGPGRLTILLRFSAAMLVYLGRVGRRRLSGKSIYQASGATVGFLDVLDPGLVPLQDV